VINPTTNTVVETTTVAASGAPTGVAVSPTGPEAGDVYVAGGDHVSVFS